MLSYSFYKVAHLVGVFMVLMPLAAQAFHMSQGGSRNHSWRRLISLVHGFGMLISVLAGFGLLARLQIEGFPVWVIAKIGIWILLGGMIGVIYRFQSKAKILWFSVLFLAGLAAYLGVVKP